MAKLALTTVRHIHTLSTKCELLFLFSEKPPVFGPCRLMDIELEMVCIVNFNICVIIVVMVAGIFRWPW